MYEVMKWSWKVKWKLLEFVNRQSWGNTGYFSMVVLQQRKEWLVLNWNRFYAEFWAVLKGKGKKKKLKWNIYFVVKRIPTTKNIWWICSKIAINLWLSQLIFAEYIYTYLKKMNTFSQARNENHMVRKVSKKKRNEKQFHDMPCLRIMMDCQLETVLHKPIQMVSMAPEKGFLQ